MLLASIPSPADGTLELGPLNIRMYGLIIAVGVFAGVWWANHRWQQRGGDPQTIPSMATWAIPAGVVGARLYHVITDWKRFRGNWDDAFKIWQGGLGIWGAIAAGTLACYIVAARRHEDKAALFDTIAPTLPLAQAIGRWGNYFNQELFGRPTDLPWALEIDPSHRPAGYQQFETFHPTFLYESLWCLVVLGLVLWVQKRGYLQKGYSFAVYVSGYTFGRFFFERIRIDTASEILGLRVNEWVSAIIFVISTVVLVLHIRREPAQPAVEEEEPEPA